MFGPADYHTVRFKPSYVDSPHTPRYYFGHGLSYTSFEYADLETNKDAYETDDTLEINCKISNTGKVRGEEVVQLYITDDVASIVQPVQSLQGFLRIALEPDETRRITFKLPFSQLAIFDKDRRWKTEAGNFTVKVGASSNDIRLSKQITLKADVYTNPQTRGFFAQTIVE